MSETDLRLLAFVAAYAVAMWQARCFGIWLERKYLEWRQRRGDAA